MTGRQESKFFKGLLLVITPVGVVIGLHEAWRLAGGMIVLLAMQILILTLVAVALVHRIRKEDR